MRRKTAFGIVLTSLLLCSLLVFFVKADETNDSPSWLTKEQIIDGMKQLCDSHSSFASYESIGKTVLGNDIWLFKFGTNEQAKILLDGATHGMETPGSHSLLLLAQWLTSGSTEANTVLSKMQVLIVPIVNYDRFANIYSAGDANLRKNINGVDLNRNHITGWTASDDPTSPYYSGTHPASEPETQAMNALFEKETPKVYVTIHDYGGDPTYNGDFRSPSYGNSLYTTEIDALHARYIQIVNGLGLDGWVNIPGSAIGSSRDDGYCDGTTLSFLSEQTQTFTPNPETINYNLIYTQKWHHYKAFVMATAEIYGATPTPSTTFTCDFESGDFSAWTTTGQGGGTHTLDIVSTVAHHGNYAMRTTIQDGGDNVRAIQSIPSTSEVYMQSYINFDDLFTVMFGVGPRFANDETTVGYVVYDPINAKWGVRVGLTNYWETETTALSTGVWQCVQLHEVISPTAGVAQLWVDNVLKVNQTGINTGTTNITQATENMYVLSGISEPTNKTVYHDCVMVSNQYIWQDDSTPNQYYLNISTSGSGSVSKNPDETSYGYATEVELTAEPSSGWMFYGWTGDLTGNTNPETISLTSNKSVTALFVQFADGFESGDFSAWSITGEGGGTHSLDVVSSTKHDGIYAMRTTIQDGGDNVRAIHSIDSTSEAYMRSCVNLGDLYTTASVVGIGPRFANSGGATLGYVFYDTTTSQWGVRFGSSNYKESGITTLSTGVWYNLELHVKISSTAGVIQLWVDGVLKVDQTDLNTGWINIDQATENAYLNAAEPAGRTVYHDCVVFSNSYIGPNR